MTHLGEAQCMPNPQHNDRVGRELGSLCDAITELSEALQALGVRLQPVSVASIAVGKTNGAELEKEKSPLAQELSCRVSQVYAMRDKVSEMMYCLDI